MEWQANCKLTYATSTYTTYQFSHVILHNLRSQLIQMAWTKKKKFCIYLTFSLMINFINIFFCKSNKKNIKTPSLLRDNFIFLLSAKAVILWVPLSSFPNSRREFPPRSYQLEPQPLNWFLVHWQITLP